MIWRVAGESVQTLNKPKQIINCSSNKLTYILQPKELEVISRYLKVIPVSVREIAETSRKSQTRVPNLVPILVHNFIAIITFQTTSGRSGAIGWSLNLSDESQVPDKPKIIISALIK